MRSYLVVIDDTNEARAALRYAARRASGTGGGVILLAVVPPAEFVQWGGVQAAMEEEAKLRAEAMVLQASGAIVEEDRKSTRLNSSHGYISYAVFCLKKK